MDSHSKRDAGMEDCHDLVLAQKTITAAMGSQPLLRGFMATGAGYLAKAAGHVRRRPKGVNQAVLIYCVKGGGWCELAGQFHTVRAGDLLVLPPDLPHACGAQATEPWTIHWAQAAGANLGAYLHELGVSAAMPVVWMGEDLQLTLLFNEVANCLSRESSSVNLLRASGALAHLVALMIGHRSERNRDSSDAAQKVAQSILYMSEHLSQPLRVTTLAALANLSPAYFTVLFKEQTGCSPRDYLHLLRIHHACQLLRRTNLSVKEIANQLGYQDPFHFSRQFKTFQGVAPSEYRT